MKILITGGIKSGKSRLALKIASRFEGEKVFIATAEPFDEEMKIRIERHKKERKGEFFTIEEPLHLHTVLGELDCSVAVVDCLTVWCGNLMHYGKLELIDDFLEAFKSVNYNIVAITNEVGLGIVPSSQFSREYIDRLGLLNQKLSSISDVVIFTVSGLPLFLKGSLEL